MATQNPNDVNMWRTIRRIVFSLVAVFMFGLFLLWRIDNPRVENIRMAIVDKFVPSFDWTVTPVTSVTRMVDDVRSYDELYEQNRELRRELQRMKGWREAALQLEERNARLMALNNVRLSPRQAFVTGEVLADSGSPFRQSALLNIGRVDGVTDGSSAVDGLGLVGRISGVAEQTSRIILLTDINSQVPSVVQPSGQKVLMSGDNTIAPPLEFIEDPENVRAGDRVVTSGDGGVYPSGLLVGQVAVGPDGRLRVRLAADYRRLEFIRVLLRNPQERIEGPGDLIGPQLPVLSGTETLGVETTAADQ